MIATPWRPEPEPTGTVEERKAAWRSALRAARRSLVTEQGAAGRAEQARRLAELGAAWIERYAARRVGRQRLAGVTVTAYEAMPTEPPVQDLVSWLRQEGVRVLVPITLPAGRLDWHVAGDAGRTPLGTSVLDDVDVALLPGLAVDREGVRLGQGGGYYDGVVPLLRPGTPTVTVLHDHEVVEELPSASWDARVWGTLTTAAGVRAL